MLTVKANKTIAATVNEAYNDKMRIPGQIAYNKMYLETKDYGGFYANHQASNCKVFNLEAIQGNLNGAGVEDSFIAKINEYADWIGRDIFQVTLTNPVYLERMQKHFTLVGRADVPIGYGMNMQYHCTFATDKGYQKWKKRFDNNTFNVTGAEKHLSLEVATKILAFKYKGALKNYLNKLINGGTL